MTALGIMLILTLMSIGIGITLYRASANNVALGALGSLVMPVSSYQLTALNQGVDTTIAVVGAGILSLVVLTLIIIHEPKAQAVRVRKEEESN